MRRKFREFFEREDDTPVLRVTNTFAPGWYIKCEATNVDDEDWLSCYLDSTDWGWMKAMSKTRGWDRFETLRNENAIYIRVAIRAQFIAHSSRTSTGTPSNPQDLFANKEVIRTACPRLANSLHNPSSVPEATKGLFGVDKGCPRHFTSNVSTLDAVFVDPDSDFEDEEERNDQRSIAVSKMGDCVTPDETSTQNGVVFDGESWETNMSPLDDSMSEWSFEDATAQARANTDPRATPVQTVEPPLPSTTLTGTAASTYVFDDGHILGSFLFYLYTGVVVFAPLKSRGEIARKKFITEYKAKNPHRPRPCSCKSMYDLAHQDNIVAEIFTEFASRYGEVKDMELRTLKEHWGELKGTEQISQILRKVVRGELPMLRPSWKPSCNALEGGTGQFVPHRYLRHAQATKEALSCCEAESESGVIYNRFSGTPVLQMIRKNTVW
ncbi:uncharacterized protein B0H18DRAFT_1185478 [Fomitopsis serialis]|uniref:uncharacterized protein n=1 Tax=Fomitopsis serialis TaxID=139415 RepID=UPI002008771B|nr:uncharacterized protein B0H18DRAFT_1185478 [Neoantrodia serialis]KAH9922246.1 hypothetical protein B0H18DRAFT_1185478 [Neoantrodia serialis]